MGPWLDAADALISDDQATLEGWHTLRGAAATMRAVFAHRLKSPRNGPGAERSRWPAAPGS
ncbi:MAG: hypothetical protein LC799_11055 [Actinobacteria bacterium]|nr:hypothetical protein [Actinomycetota bacterium]